MTRPAKRPTKARTWKAWACFTEYGSLIVAKRKKAEADYIGRTTPGWAYMLLPVLLTEIRPVPATPRRRSR